jgi:hypothetical protein
MRLFHYCSADAFFKIVSNKTIWLSSLTASNDAMEGKWFSQVIRSAALAHNIWPFDVSSLVEMASNIESNLDCLGFCMSAAEDTLSQWRGYADDGRGFSIGFSSSFIDKIKTTSFESLQRIVYDEQEQIELIAHMFPAIIEEIANGAFRTAAPGSLLTPRSAEDQEADREQFLAAHGRLFKVLTRDLDMFFAMKNPAFGEERESRLISMAIKPLSNLDFRFAGSKIIPYEQKSFEGFEGAIDRVLIGPKNPTPKDVVVGFLAKHGFDEVDVDVSRASYR